MRSVAYGRRKRAILFSSPQYPLALLLASSRPEALSRGRFTHHASLVRAVACPDVAGRM